MTWDDFWQWAQTPLGGTIVGGLIVAAIVGVIARIPKLRKPVFGFIARTARRVPIRVTTPNRRAASLAAEYRRGVRYTKRAVRVEALAEAEKTVSAQLASKHEKALRDQELRNRAEQTQSFLRGKAARQKEFDAEKAAEGPVLPPPQPRWKAYPDPDEPGRFILRNTVDRSIAHEVRLEAVGNHDFEFDDGAHWADCSGPSLVEFQGRVNGDLDQTHVFLTVLWFDERGQRQQAEVSLPTDTEGSF